MISGYEVITATKIADLQDRVREKITAGWRPTGGIAFLRDEELGDDKTHMVFAQALVTAESQGRTARG
jgi:hypothetical protein